MAIAATTVWEINAAATAANVNGGGFNPSNTGNSGGPGTDYSQGTLAHANGTDLASTSASSFLVITSATYTFLASDCGNIIHINTSGTGAHFSAGVYEIVSVSGGAATLDRACGSVSNASGGTWHLGGAFSMADASDNTTFNFGVSGNSWWVKSGTYVIGANWNVPGTGTAAAIQNFQGYQTNRGDNPTGSNRPLIKLNGSLILWGGPYWNIANISVIGTSINDTYGAFGAVGTFVRITNCKAVNQSTADHAGMIVGVSTSIIGCELVAYGSSGLKWSSNSTLQITDCYFHDSINGILQSYGGSAVGIEVTGCTFENLTTAGINLSSATATGPYLIKNCTFYGGETTKIGSGILMQQTVPSLFTAINNIFYGLVTGINCTNAAGINTTFENFNCFNNCTTARTNITAGTSSITTNPTFTSVGQYVKSGTVTSSGTTLTDTTAAFANVVGGRDYLYVTASTGGNTGIFGIVSTNNSTTVTVDNSLGTGSGITYSIIWGHNFAVGSNMKAVGWALTGNTSQTSYIDIGAVQRQETVSTDPGIANVRLATGYNINGSALTGTLNLPAVSDVRLAVTFDNATKTGTARIPAIANVKNGYAYDSSDSLIGIYDPITGNYTNPGATHVQNLTGYTFAGVSLTGSLISTDPGIANVRLGTGYTIQNASLTGSLGASADPGIANVKLGTGYTIDGTSLTGALAVPISASGTANSVQINTIKETIRYVLETANTTTGLPIDLSSNLTQRVKTVLKVNPEKLRPDAPLFPCVTTFLSQKKIEAKTISKDQVVGARKAVLSFKVVGMMWNQNMTTYKEDPADNDLEYLMENVEVVLRHYATLNNLCNWQIPHAVTYHSSGYDEQTHMRVGIIDLEVMIYY